MLPAVDDLYYLSNARSIVLPKKKGNNGTCSLHHSFSAILRSMTDVEVDIATDGNGRAVIEGKTSVPFRTFVTLILQRRVQQLFKSNAEDVVIVSSELLTALASAPGDKQEDKGKLVLVTFGVGILAGVFVAGLVLLGLMLFKIELQIRDIAIFLGVIVAVGILGVLLQKNQKKSTFTEKLFDAMEKTTDLVSR